MADYLDQFGPETENESLDLNSFSSASTSAQTEKKHKKKKGKQRFLKVLLTVFLIGVISVSIVVGAFAVYVFSMDNSIDMDLNDLKLNFTTTIYANDGNGNWNEYQRLHGEFNRIWVPYDRDAATALSEDYTGIPQNLVNAYVSIEDKRFYSHKGTDWKRTIMGFVNEFLPVYSSRQGGSTITQQLVKNLTDDKKQNASRKIREIMRARYLEEHYSKDVIIECYLNTIAMGHGTYGVEVAANYYFNKSVHELTLAECATLAAITKSPSYYAPDTNPENNRGRRNQILKEMLDQGYISQADHDAAVAEEPVIVATGEALKETEIYSYYVDALIDEVVADLAEKYNYDTKAANLLFYSSGFKIYANLDPNIQSKMESVYVKSDTYGLKGADGQTLQGSMTVMDYNGHVKGIVGGIGEKTGNRSLNRATSAIRQPGSTVKPLSAYAPAIEQNLITYSTIMHDTATNYNGWKPVNWYNAYWGNITVEYALERSVNTIPVYLVNKMNPQTSFDFLTQKLGITTLTAEDVNLSPMGMGGTNGGITTMESAAAFAIFGNNGVYHKPTLYTKVCDQHGDVILSHEKDTPTLAITEDTATVMNHLLQNVVYGGNGTGKAAAGAIPQMKFYAKTGTSNSQIDLWFVGGTPYYVASAWCGYDKQQDISQSSIALKMWSAVMSKIYDGMPAKEFTDSNYVKDRYYCTETGLLATDACPSKACGWYKTSNVPGLCTAHSGAALDSPSVIAAREAAAAEQAAKEAAEQAAASEAPAQ